jgi:hypothetical protein
MSGSFVFNTEAALRGHHIEDSNDSSAGTVSPRVTGRPSELKHIRASLIDHPTGKKVLLYARPFRMTACDSGDCPFKGMAASGLCLAKSSRSFADLEGEAQDATRMPGVQGCQRRTTVHACLVSARGAGEGVYRTIDLWNITSTGGGKFVVDRRKP